MHVLQGSAVVSRVFLLKMCNLTSTRNEDEMYENVYHA